MHASGPALGDALTMRTLPTFFSVLELLLRAGVTTVAEAAFQDHVWRPRLDGYRPGLDFIRRWIGSSLSAGGGAAHGEGLAQ